MFTNKIFCFGDGYAHGHVWPEWPQILQVLLPDWDIVTHTGVGAGNEFLIDCLLNCEIQNQTVIFQWANPQRFDKLLQDTDWIQRAHKDPVYFFNFENNSSGTWWLSSASRDQKITEYHDFFVQDQQAQLRFQNQKILVENYLQNQRCRYYFSSSTEQEHFCQQHPAAHLRGQEIQPSPVLHFHFVTDCLIPALDLPVDPTLKEKLKDLILTTNWQSYDPDRREIWRQICEQIQGK